MLIGVFPETGELPGLLKKRIRGKNRGTVLDFKKR
jgi:hypothetical protein